MLLGSSSEKKKPNIPPILFIENGIPDSIIKVFIPSKSTDAFLSNSLNGFSLINNCNKAVPPAIASGLPDKVPAW